MRAVTDESFESEVLRSRRPVLVDFWAPWCGPCKQMTPILEAIESDFRDTWEVVAVNADSCPATVRACKVLSLPTYLVFRDGAEVGRVSGARPRQAIEKLMSRGPEQ
jgi:thioredoxin 1